MQSLPDPFAPLGAYRQFVAYRLVPSRDREGKTDKFPLDASGHVVGASDPAALCSFEEAAARAAAVGHGVGFTFTEADPFFFLDVDGALGPDGQWSELAAQACGMFPHAAVEISQSGRGLHIIGSGQAPEHGCRNMPLGLEFYTRQRFVALTGSGVRGSAAADCTAALQAIVPLWFPPAVHNGAGWTEGPVRDGLGVADDAELLERALKSRSVAGAFSGKASFADLWTCNAQALAVAYPDPDRPYDASSADAALAQHLAFWTGGDCERVARLMRESGLARDKYEREDYLPRTVSRACGLQETYYEAPSPVEAAGLTGSAKEKQWADTIRAGMLAQLPEGEDRDRLAAKRSARFWIDNRDKAPEELARAAKPIERPETVMVDTVVEREGYAYQGTTMQREHFAGCVYVQSRHAILTPAGTFLDQGPFKATYGGYAFEIDSSGKSTPDAWKAFTESQLLKWPIAEGACFRPSLPFGTLVDEEGVRLVNTFKPVPVRTVHGDPSPFLRHLEKLLPDPTDRAVALAYMAACVQHVGVKFQWAPLFQGVEGNGKTLLSYCVEYAVGRKYTHYPDAQDLDNKFNLWLLRKLFIGVEDVYVPEHKGLVMERLKPMITNRRQPIQGKGADQVTEEVCANFILNSNHRDAIRKSLNDRRFAVFFTAQQEADDLRRDGMDGEYFPDLYRWLDEQDGLAIVAGYLSSYPIPYELDPAGGCHRAPATSSTGEAVEASMGSVEQEILEAIEEGRPGFCGGWVSSMAVDRLLQSLRMGRAVPPNKRRDLLRSLGYDWHPSLKGGRSPSVVPLDGGKPRLFVRIGTGRADLRPVDVIEAYQKAQGVETFPPAGAGRVA